MGRMPALRNLTAPFTTARAACRFATLRPKAFLARKFGTWKRAPRRRLAAGTLLASASRAPEAIARTPPRPQRHPRSQTIAILPRPRHAQLSLPARTILRPRPAMTPSALRFSIRLPARPRTAFTLRIRCPALTRTVARRALKLQTRTSAQRPLAAAPSTTSLALLLWREPAKMLLASTFSARPHAEATVSGTQLANTATVQAPRRAVK